MPSMGGRVVRGFRGVRARRGGDEVGGVDEPATILVRVAVALAERDVLSTPIGVILSRIGSL